MVYGETQLVFWGMGFLSFGVYIKYNIDIKKTEEITDEKN